MECSYHRREKKEEESTENAENQTDEDEEADLVYEVKKYTMDEWKKMKHEEKRPLISAYYRSIPQSTSHIGKGPISSSKERHERPQRIKIASNVLLDELEDLSDVIVPTYAPFVYDSPFYSDSTTLLMISGRWTVWPLHTRYVTKQTRFHNYK